MTGPAKQISSAPHECKKMISMSKFFTSRGEIREWKTGLNMTFQDYHWSLLFLEICGNNVDFRSSFGTY